MYVVFISPIDVHVSVKRRVYGVAANADDDSVPRGNGENKEDIRPDENPKWTEIQNRIVRDDVVAFERDVQIVRINGR